MQSYPLPYCARDFNFIHAESIHNGESTSQLFFVKQQLHDMYGIWRALTSTGSTDVNLTID